MSMYSDAPTEKVIGFAVSHIRNDVELPTDLVAELIVRGFSYADLETTNELVNYVNEFDLYYRTFLDGAAEEDFDIDPEAFEDEGF